MYLRRTAASAILVLAAVLRLWRLDVTPFGTDEAALTRLAEDIVRLGRIPLIGPLTSIGIPSAPHFIYTLAPLEALTRDPAVVAGFIAVLNIAAVFGSWWLGTRWFGAPAGIVAALLFATSPWAISASRWIWQPDLLPPLAVLLAIALDLGVVQRRAWWSAATLPIATFGALAHPAFVLIAPLVLAPLAMLISARRIAPILVAVGVSAVIAAPFLVHEIQTRLVDVANYRYYASLNTFVDLDSVRYLVALASNLGSPRTPGALPLEHAFPSALVTAAAWLETGLFALGLVAVIVGLLHANTTVPRREVRLRSAGLLLWLALPVILTIRHSFPVQVHYLLVAYPAPFIAIGAAINWLLRAGSSARISAAGLMAAVVAVAAVQASATASAIQHLTVTEDVCYGTTLRTASARADDVLALSNQAASQHAAIELNAADALPTAYIVRGTLPEVDLAASGSIGVLGSTGNRLQKSITEPLTLTSAGPTELDYVNGVRLIRALNAPTADADQVVRLALVWSLGTQAPPNRPLVWNVSIHDAQNRKVFDHSGMDHLPGAPGSQPIVSLFAIDAPTELAAPLSPGAYTLEVQLVDAFDSAPVALASGGSSTWSVGPITVAPVARCA